MGHLGLTDCLAEGEYCYHRSGLVVHLEECCYLCYLAAWRQHSCNANQESKQRDKDEYPQWFVFASEELV